MRKLIITVLTVFALAAPAAAQAGQQHAAAARVSATVTYKKATFNDDRDINVKISDHGSLVFDAKVTGTCASACMVLPHALKIHNLQGQPDDVVLQLYTGGAHCCFFDAVYSPVSGSSTWASSSYDFGDPGAALRDLGHNGRTEFLTADDRFAYTFTDFAESGLPIEILKFGDQRFTNVTRHYPGLIRRDAKRWWKAYMKDHDSGRRGLIAAWAADEWNLRRKQHAGKVLHAQVSEGHITAGFVKHLDHFLAKHGY